MKKYLFFLCVCPFLLMSQVGVNTIFPIGVFHVDGSANNPSITPTVAQQADDFIITSAGAVGIGLTTPAFSLDMVGASTDAFRSTTYGAAPRFDYRRSGGSATTPTNIANNDVLANLRFFGYHTSFSQAATIKVEADAAPSATSMPGRLVFETTPATTVTPVERMRIASDGRILMNTTTFVTGDILRVVAGGSEAAINGYTTTGISLYGEATSGFGVIGFVTTGVGVIGDATTSSGDGILGLASTGDGVYGESTSGDGVWGSATTGVAVRGTATTGIGIRGSSSGSTALGGRFSNSNTSGTGLTAIGQNSSGFTLAGGSGLASNGQGVGLVAFGNDATTGWGTLAAGNNLSAVGYLTGGGGGAFSGRQWGVYGNATLSGSGGTDRAAFVGQFNEISTLRTVYLGARIGSTNYKVLGTGATSVSTTMPTRDGERILFAPESPENWFFDIGEAQLINGKATVEIDPLFVDCISEAVPFKVFVQGAEDVLGTISVKRNQNAKTFELIDLGGTSNGVVQYKIYGIWKGKENLRLPVYAQPFEYQEIKKERVDYNENFITKDKKYIRPIKVEEQANK